MNRTDHPLELILLGHQMLLAGGGERVETRAAIVFGRTPLGAHVPVEQQPLERLAGDGRLSGYRHEGFWDCMDTYKDAVTLNDLWGDGQAPWAVWEPEVARSGAR